MEKDPKNNSNTLKNVTITAAVAGAMAASILIAEHFGLSLPDINELPPQPEDKIIDELFELPVDYF